MIDGSMSPSCPVRGQNLGPVGWQRKAIYLYTKQNISITQFSASMSYFKGPNGGTLPFGTGFCGFESLFGHGCS